ncbi:hypothetical protein AB5I41_13055 [Sphingomonas sp. MMS24-JH45]
MPTGVAQLYTYDDIYRGKGPTSSNAIYIEGNPATDYARTAQRVQAINALWIAKGAFSWLAAAGEPLGRDAGHRLSPQ